jgi:hypothetical protein
MRTERIRSSVAHPDAEARACLAQHALVHRFQRAGNRSYDCSAVSPVGEVRVKNRTVPWRPASFVTLVIDQPEEDLGNSCVDKIDVDLLRKRKFSRQIIVATRNAKIPVNGDAELIVFRINSGARCARGASMSRNKSARFLKGALRHSGFDASAMGTDAPMSMRLQSVDAA